MATPDRKDRTRPLELVGLSGVLAAVIFGVVLMGTRDPILSAQFGGLGFIATLVVLAMLALAIRPKDAEVADLAEQNDAADSDGTPPPPRGH